MYNYADIHQLPTPLQLDGKTYPYHINRIYYGETKEALLALSKAHRTLEVQSSMGALLADLLYQDARAGKVMLIADQSGYVAENAVGRWLHRPEWEGMLIDQKRYDGRCIKIGIGKNSIAELSGTLGHEATHHLAVVINRKIEPGVISFDPAFSSELFQQKLLNAYKNDYANIKLIQDREIKSLANALFEAPASVLQESKSLEKAINELITKHNQVSLNQNELVKLSRLLLAKNQADFRGEIAAYFLEADIRLGGALSKIAPQTSQVLYQCLFGQPNLGYASLTANRTHAQTSAFLFPKASGSSALDLSSVINPIPMPRPPRAANTGSVVNHHWTRLTKSPIAGMANIRPLPQAFEYISGSWHDISKAAINYSLYDAGFVFRPSLIVLEDFALNDVLIQLDENARIDFWRKRGMLVNKQHPSIPLDQFKIIRWANFARAAGYSVPLILFGARAYNAYSVNPDTPWFANSLMHTGVDCAVYAPIVWVTGPWSIPLFAADAFHEPIDNLYRYEFDRLMKMQPATDWRGMIEQHMVFQSTCESGAYALFAKLVHSAMGPVNVAASNIDNAATEFYQKLCLAIPERHHQLDQKHQQWLASPEGQRAGEEERDSKRELYDEQKGPLGILSYLTEKGVSAVLRATHDTIFTPMGAESTSTNKAEIGDQLVEFRS